MFEQAVEVDNDVITDEAEIEPLALIPGILLPLVLSRSNPIRGIRLDESCHEKFEFEWSRRRNGRKKPNEA